MKPLYTVLISIIILATACNNKKKSGETNPTAMNDSTATPAQLQKEEELQALTPYTAQQMQALLPAELAGGPLTDPSSGEATGTAFARGVYASTDTSVIELSIFDCGGSGGAGFYKYQFLNMLNAEPTSEEEEIKVIDYKGERAIEQYDADSYQSVFTYLSGRFLVTLQSEFLDIDGLKKIADGLELK